MDVINNIVKTLRIQFKQISQKYVQGEGGGITGARLSRGHPETHIGSLFGG